MTHGTETLLKIESSMFHEGGQSTVLARQFADRWQAAGKERQIISHDLAAENIPHLDLERLQALMTPEGERSPTQQTMVDFADNLIAEIQQADVLVMGVPMYNFTIPSVLKAWFDYIARAGVTFRYTADGPEGLLKNKKAFVFVTRGGFYGEDEHSQTALLRQYLGFVGIDDVEIIYAEGLNLDEATKEKSLARANERIRSLAA